jgi:hypothetical protein
MSKKKKIKREISVVFLHIYGIFDNNTKKVVYVSLDLEDVEMELALKDEKFCRCEFKTTLLL